MRGILKLLLVCAAAGFVFYFSQSRTANVVEPRSNAEAKSATSTWGNPDSLPDHFARHGAGFQARDANEYALLAHNFLERAKAESLPTKIDDRGVIRVFDARTGTFGAYNRNGTTKTFFKPGGPHYFDRQPGRLVNLKTA